MAAPTNFRVWAIAQTSTFLKWSNSVNHAVEVYRSTDGSSYTNVATVVFGTSSYQDEGLAAGTKYWYKVTNDSGSSFSLVKTVKTHACGDTSVKHRKAFSLPRFKRKGEKDARSHERAMRDLEDIIEKKVLHQKDCVACVEDGAIIINCLQDCECWDVEVTEDINSITFINCEGIDPCIHFRVPPNVTRGICGFPQGHDSFSMQFTGDECFSNPIPGGAAGRTMTTGPKPPRSKPGGGASGGAGGGTACECIPSASGGLTIKCCSTNCSVDCSSTKQLQIKVCGGTGPYTITGSAGLTFKKQGGATVTTFNPGDTVIVAPPANTGSGVVGVAYVKNYFACTSCASGLCNLVQQPGGFHRDFKCDDSDVGTCFTTADGHTHCSPTVPAVLSATCFSVTGGCLPDCIVNCGSNKTISTCDDRTAGMIASGCNPCGIATLSKTITVTDADGVSVIKTISA